MSTLMGGQAEATDEMFSKLESMRAVITEVNTQFKDPVRVCSSLTYAPPHFSFWVFNHERSRGGEGRLARDDK